MECSRIPAADKWDELPPQQLEQCRLHVRSCGACRRRVLAEAPEQLLFDLGPLAEVLRVLVWAGAVVGAVLAAMYVAQRLFPGALGDPPFEEPGAELSPALSDAPLRDAQALAREGRFAEAIHVLLLRTFEQLLRGRGIALAPGWTSREVLERASYPGQAREALAGLVGAVETCTFAGRPASEEDYRLCADRFRHLAAALGGAG